MTATPRPAGSVRQVIFIMVLERDAGRKALRGRAHAALNALQLLRLLRLLRAVTLLRSRTMLTGVEASRRTRDIFSQRICRVLSIFPARSAVRASCAPTQRKESTKKSQRKHKRNRKVSTNTSYRKHKESAK